MRPTLPNLMTIYRLIAAPVAAAMALLGYRKAFVLLIALSLMSDLLDGPIARWLKQDSSLGARLDTLADGGTVLAGLLGVFMFEWSSIKPELPWLYAFLASYAGAASLSLLKFRALPAFHLYSSKAAAVASAVFFVWLFMIGYSAPLFITVICIGIAANLESMWVTRLLRRFRTDIHSVIALIASNRE